MADPSLILGGLSLASSLLGSSEENARIEQTAADFGTRQAGIEFTTKLRLTALASSIRSVLENETFEEARINKLQAKAEADTRVAAAAAGVAGSSVDVAVGDTERTAAEAVEQIERETEQQQRQIQLSFIDQTINAEQSIGQLNTKTKSNGLKHVLAFASGFANGGGFGE